MKTSSRRRDAAPAHGRIVALLLLVAAVAGGCARQPVAHESAAAPARVQVARFEGGAAAAALVLPARIKSSEEITIRSRLNARLGSFTVREGDRVAEGAILARFDSPETRAALVAARAERDAAEAARSLASRQEARLESLFAAGVVSTRDREVAGSERRSADARVGAARATLEALERGALVRAPFAAVVVRRHVDAGADVAAQDPLLDLRSAAALEAVADVPEGAVAALRAGSPRVQSGDGAWHPARLARLDGMTDFRSRTRTAHFALPEGGAWEPGAFARVALTPDAEGRGTVPASSLVRRGAMTGVYVVANGTSRLRWLKPGRETANGVEVLAGLEPGEVFVLDAGGVADGRAVEALP